MFRSHPAWFVLINFQSASGHSGITLLLLTLARESTTVRMQLVRGKTKLVAVEIFP